MLSVKIPKVEKNEIFFQKNEKKFAKCLQV